MSKIKVAIVGLGNCANSLIQGVEYYKNADVNAEVPGLMHVQLGDYHIKDIEFVAAFDVDGKKVGLDLSADDLIKGLQSLQKTLFCLDSSHGYLCES